MTVGLDAEPKKKKKEKKKKKKKKKKKQTDETSKDETSTDLNLPNNTKQLHVHTIVNFKPNSLQYNYLIEKYPCKGVSFRKKGTSRQ